MIIPITVKFINTNKQCSDLFGREITFDFDINLTINSLKSYIISYYDLVDIETKDIEIVKNNIVWLNLCTLRNTMNNHLLLDILENNDNIFYLYFCMRNR